MALKRWLICVTCVTTVISLTSCKVGKTSQSLSDTASSATSSPGSYGTPEAGVEKVKPAPGKGNVQGKVLYNSKPAENIEVKLCETFNQYFGGCSGKTYTARTDKSGEYVITNAEPKAYEGLTARVFDSGFYVFAASGIGGLDSAKYEVLADKTLFVSPTNLFKNDLKLLNPKAAAKTGAQNLELKWAPYPEASYYKFSVYADDAGVTSPYINERIEATSYVLDKPLQKGAYHWQVDAYNSADTKLSQSESNIKFTITDNSNP